MCLTAPKLYLSEKNWEEKEMLNPVGYGARSWAMGDEAQRPSMTGMLVGEGGRGRALHNSRPALQVTLELSLRTLNLACWADKLRKAVPRRRQSNNEETN